MGKRGGDGCGEREGQRRRRGRGKGGGDVAGTLALLRIAEGQLRVKITSQVDPKNSQKLESGRDQNVVRMSTGVGAC